tara:strand:+ start:361 stop:513 length:153 start_codon:yes stop_codon:yes gene_type:complete
MDSLFLDGVITFLLGITFQRIHIPLPVNELGFEICCTGNGFERQINHPLG